MCLLNISNKTSIAFVQYTFTYIYYGYFCEFKWGKSLNITTFY